MKSGHFFNLETAVVVSQKVYPYDANGNLTNDGRMAHFWNDENRLVAVRSAKTGALIQENRYDGLGRRRERIQSAVAGGDDPGSTNRYIYQDWLVLAVTDGDGNVLETYTHGADLSGQVGGGAGGIGGILASTQAGGAAYYHYDFNGNVVNVSSSNQTQLAKYTYGPFGEVLLKEGAFVSRYQFSTKEYDPSTGLNYYGYRFYSPGLGRWMNRDPIEEEGGYNLYLFVGNTFVGMVYPLGMKACEPSISGDLDIDFSDSNVDITIKQCRIKFRWHGRHLGFGFAECDVTARLEAPVTAKCIKVDECCKETIKSWSFNGWAEMDAIVGVGFRAKSRWSTRYRLIRKAISGSKHASEIQLALEASIKAKYAADELCKKAFNE
jgi:RHS repeat-associated protein